MGYGYNDVYNDAAEFNLTFLGEIEWDDESYSFNLTGVWKNDVGDYYMGDDSGCSCPSPYENFTSVSDLDGPYDKQAVVSNLNRKVEEQCNDDSRATYHWGRSRAELSKDVRDLVARL